jgi:hypothetical protein
MDSLEARVTLLEELPARVDALASQISQLRDEMRGEFSAVRGEFRSEFSAVRGEFSAIRAEFRGELSAVRSEFRGKFSVVRGEIQTGLAEVMTRARLLHEDQKAALALIAEALQSRNERQRNE